MSFKYGQNLQENGEFPYICFSKRGAAADATYGIPYAANGRKLTKCGVRISSEARNITHWRTVDAEGRVTDEQDFE